MNITRRMFLKGAAAVASIAAVPAVIANKKVVDDKPELRFARTESVRFIETPNTQKDSDNTELLSFDNGGIILTDVEFAQSAQFFPAYNYRGYAHIHDKPEVKKTFNVMVYEKSMVYDYDFRRDLYEQLSISFRNS